MSDEPKSQLSHRLSHPRAVKSGSSVLLGMTALVVLTIAACGDEPKAPEAAEVSVCDAVEGKVPEGTLSIRGRVVPLSKLGAAGSPGSLTGFVLTAEGCSVLVDTGDRSRVAGLQGQVTVRGEVSIRSGLEAERFRNALDLQEGTDTIDERVPSTVAIGTGARFIDAFSLSVLPEE